MAAKTNSKSGGKRNPARAARPVASWRTDRGRRLLTIENAHFLVELWPGKGGAVTRYVHRPTGLDALWHNAQGQPPRLHGLDQPAGPGTDLFDTMDGSWYVSLPNGFFPADYFGAPLGTHGELRCVPWAVTEVRAAGESLTVTLIGKSVRTPLVYRRALTARTGSARLSWSETVENRAGEPLPIAWLHHPAFGGPLVDGARLVAPARSVSVNPTNTPASLQLKAGYKGRWPRVPERTGGRVRDCSVVPPDGTGSDHSVQLSDFSEGWGCVWNEGLGLGFAMEWDLAMFPHAWSWVHCGGGKARYPMWGQGHLVTLQPSTSPPAPFAELRRRGELRVVPAGGSVTAEMSTGFVARAEAPWPA